MSTAQRRDSPAQAINQGFPNGCQRHSVVLWAISQQYERGFTHLCDQHVIFPLVQSLPVRINYCVQVSANVKLRTVFMFQTLEPFQILILFRQLPCQVTNQKILIGSQFHFTRAIDTEGYLRRYAEWKRFPYKHMATAKNSKIKACDRGKSGVYF